MWGVTGQVAALLKESWCPGRQGAEHDPAVSRGWWRLVAQWPIKRSIASRLRKCFSLLLPLLSVYSPSYRNTVSNFQSLNGRNIVADWNGFGVELPICSIYPVKRGWGNWASSAFQKRWLQGELAIALNPNKGISSKIELWPLSRLNNERESKWS